MEKHIKMFGLLLIMTLIVSCGKEQTAMNTNVNENLSYNNSQYGIKMNYPKDWEIQNVEGTIFTALSPIENENDLFRENISIVVKDLSAQPMSLDKYTEASKNLISSLINNVEIITSEKTKFANKDGYKLVYTGIQGNYKLKWINIFTIKDNKVYAITFTSEESNFNKFEQIVNEMIKSFVIE